MTEGITPGSLAARILEHMKVARGEFEAGELAETLQVDFSEARMALAALRTCHRVTMRNEDGHPLYRAVGTEPDTIPGSAMKIIGIEPPKGRGRPANPATTPEETPMPKKKAEPTPAPRTKQQERVLTFLKAHPGGHTRESVTSGTGLSYSQTRLTLKTLAHDKRVARSGTTSNSIWHLPGEKVTAKPKPPANRAGPEKGPAKRPNLAQFGATAKTSAGSGPALAIDAAGMVAIDSLRLAPAQVERLVAFLEKTQPIWRNAA